MVRIRLQRLGAKKRPFYRIVVIDARKRRDGRVIENLGTYNPLTEPAEVTINLERVKEWQGKGASLSDTVSDIVRKYEAGKFIPSSEEAMITGQASQARVEGED